MTSARERSTDPFSIVRGLLDWDPFSEMGLLARGMPSEQGFIPRVEVKETKDAYVLRADLPGIKEADVEIAVTGNRITISGTREVEDVRENERYYTFEREYGTFARSFTLPDGADTEHVRAEMNNGVLTVTVPKKAEVQPRRISIEGQKESAARPQGQQQQQQQQQPPQEQPAATAREEKKQEKAA